MRLAHHGRRTGAALLAAAALVLAGCSGSGTGGGSGSGGGASSSGGAAGSGSGSAGGSGGSSSGTASGKTGGTATVDLVSSPGSLDPGLAFTAPSQDADWLVYTGLLTYAHANGAAGAAVVPALATAMPVITNGGKTYTLTLRPGLKYSTGAPAKAGDFAYAIKRAIKLNWGGVSFLTATIKGATEYQTGKAATVSGITTDDATGKIVINLLAPYGPFDNLLAFTAAGLVPTGTPMSDLITNPPPGVGPYMFAKVVPEHSFQLVKTPGFAAFAIPNVPTGNLDTITVQTQSNPLSAAEDVLQNRADAFDPSNSVPASLLSTIQRQAKDRFTSVPTAWTFYFWMNTKLPPFNNKDARLAVSEAVDRTALQRLSSGFLSPGCRFIPPTVPGHVDGDCVTQTGGSPDLAKAKSLVASSGMAGAPVTVWGPNSSPRSAYVDYYTQVLNSIGFKATSKLTTPAVYGQTIGAAATKAQTGYGDWLQDFPNPVDFFLPLSAASINPQHNINYSNINDPKIESALTKLNQVSTGQLQSVAPQWSALDRYVNEQAYEFTYGYAQLPKFLSTKLDYGSAVFSPIYLNDYSSWRLRG